MLTFLTAIGGIGLLALASLGLLGLFHFLLLREIFHSKKINSLRMEQLEKLTHGEISKSQKLHSEVDQLQQLKVEADEKLGMRQTFLKMMRKDEKKGPSSQGPI